MGWNGMGWSKRDRIYVHCVLQLLTFSVIAASVSRRSNNNSASSAIEHNLEHHSAARVVLYTGYLYIQYHHTVSMSHSQ